MNTIKHSGYFLVATGIIHNLIGLVLGWNVLVEMHQYGWFASTVVEGEMLFNREAIIWFILSGTFWIVFGLTLQKSITQGFVPPVSLGWSFVVIGIVVAIIMPVSGAYLFIVQGGLLVHGCSQHKSNIES